MSRTLADVEVDAVYLDNTGDYVWKDMGGTVLCRRRRDGRFYSLGSIEAHHLKVFGDSLGTSADEPWRNQPGTPTDAHHRIDELASVVSNHGYELGKLADKIAALENRPVVPDGFVQNCADTDLDFDRRIEKLEHALKPKVGEVRLQAERPAPAKSEPPPEVAMTDKPINDGGPAFPRTVPTGYTDGHPGMSLRAYFAAHAPNETWPWLPVDWKFDEPSPFKDIPITRIPTQSEELAQREWERRRDGAAHIVGRWAYADAMIKEMQK